MTFKPKGYVEWFPSSEAEDHKKRIISNPEELGLMKYRLQELEDMVANNPDRCAMSKDHLMYLRGFVAEIEEELNNSVAILSNN